MSREHTITFEINRADQTLELVIEYTMSAYVAAQTYGPPEHCSPTEGGEIEMLEATLDGETFELTAEEQERIEAHIYDTHDYAADDCDREDDYDDFGRDYE